MTRDASPLPPSPIATADAAELQARIFAWYSDNRRDLPWRRTTDPYAILVSETMLQQTQVARVVPKYEAFLQAFPTLEDLAAAALGDVLRLWQGLGYNNRGRRLRDCAAAVTGDMGAPSPRRAALPRDLDQLLRLPGVGPYTARAVLVFAHNDDLAAVDANVRRVLVHELRLPHDLGDAALRRVAEAVLPCGRSRDWHNALMDYGAAVLTGRATGIPARTRQSAFEGSRRWHRSRVLRLLLASGPMSVHELAAALGLAPADAADVAARLEADGLLRREGDVVRVA